MTTTTTEERPPLHPRTRRAYLALWVLGVLAFVGAAFTDSHPPTAGLRFLADSLFPAGLLLGGITWKRPYLSGALWLACGLAALGVALAFR
ncbi:hypothetical protein [Nitrospirillum iridis]|uniref:Uncharacterized protein n=1 Tax=Nitrospirillum iridis TaxID=765888 RepID=A0A7X0EC87_9PROT|nr:hypothetical protein [Nitrospirillum iridis]MBB6251457.1 hypothetical protein [Nitrospirillum iridis]